MPVAIPDRIRKSQLFFVMLTIPPWEFVRNTIPQAMITTTMVLRAVARLEFTPSIPIFARIEVNAANRDEANAKRSHMFDSSMGGIRVVCWFALIIAPFMGDNPSRFYFFLVFMCYEGNLYNGLTAIMALRQKGDILLQVSP